ncbi:MAG: RNA polymerase sigma factor [Solirubrobacteraceae bacterium]
MASLDSLPGDQRAVLQLVLGRGRSYDEIARLLSIDRSAVRNRALAAVRTLGPVSFADEERQALIADYLLGQSDEEGRASAHDLLADSGNARDWASAVAAELAPLATEPLPAIPEAGAPSADADEAAVPVPPPEPATPPPPEPATPPLPEPVPAPEPAPPPPPAPSEAPADAAQSADQEPEERKQKGRRRRQRRKAEPAEGQPRSSRIGGLVLIAVSIAAIVVIVVLLLRRNSNPNPPPASTPSAQSTPAAGSSSVTTVSSSTSASSTTTAKALAQINLSPPAGSNSKAAGVAEILSEGSTDGIAIVAQHVPPNKTHPPNAYAVWLYNAPTDAHILGFVNPGVGSSGRFSTATTLPANAKRYHEVIVTVETSGSPKKPGAVILKGPLTGL